MSVQASPSHDPVANDVKKKMKRKGDRDMRAIISGPQFGSVMAPIPLPADTPIDATDG